MRSLISQTFTPKGKSLVEDWVIKINKSVPISSINGKFQFFLRVVLWKEFSSLTTDYTSNTLRLMNIYQWQWFSFLCRTYQVHVNFNVPTEKSYFISTSGISQKALSYRKNIILRSKLMSLTQHLTNLTGTASCLLNLNVRIIFSP